MMRLLLWGTHGSIGGVPPGRPPDKPRPPKQLIREAGSLIPTRVTVEQWQQAAGDAWNFVVNMGLKPAIARMESQPGAPGTQPGQPGGHPGGNPGSGPGGPGNGGGGKEKVHVVVKGESLSIIAGKYYQDVLLWPVIHDANRQRIGSSPNLIEPAWRLDIPSIAGFTPGQLESIRQRGRNC